MASLGRTHRSVRRGGPAFDPLRAHLTLRRETGELGLSQPLQRRTLSAVSLGEHDRPGQTGGYSHQFPIRLPQPRRPVPGQRGHLAHLPHPHRRHAAQRHGGGAPHRPESRRRPLHGRGGYLLLPRPEAGPSAGPHRRLPRDAMAADPVSGADVPAIPSRSDGRSHTAGVHRLRWAGAAVVGLLLPAPHRLPWAGGSGTAADHRRLRRHRRLRLPLLI